MLTKCANLLTDRLLHIYEAIFERGMLYEPWLHSTTVVLRKPGKPRYDVPKAYRPIALLNTMWKVLTALIADQLTYVTEEHQLLPANHFGGRPGRTTTDAMHLLTHTIKTAWRGGKVASVLFLDIEGAFPNAVPSRLEHNLRKRKVPGKIADFIRNMLRRRETVLRFDGYTSQPIIIDNGIGQGDPLSMGIYQYYNADILEIPREKGESAIAYVDDGILIAIANKFSKVHDMLYNMMTRAGGIADWSSSHNSPLEYSKLALIDFAHRNKPVKRVPLCLLQRSVAPVESTKYLGVIFNQNLNWKAQHANAISKGTKWALQIGRLVKPTWGISPNYARKLYISVAIPKALYAADVWCNPSRAAFSRRKGTAKVIKQLTTIQRAGALAITGGLRSSPMDALDATAFLMPATLTVDKWCHRVMVRLATLPVMHPLHKIVASKVTRRISRHKAPLNCLLGMYNLNPKKVEKIPAAARHPAQKGELPFSIVIPESRDISFVEAANATEEIQVYADGSAINSQVGAAAVLIRAGKVQRTLHLHLGSECEHTVHEAELSGILLGLRLVSTEQHGSTMCMLGVDNQAAIKAFSSDLRKPGHHLARKAICIATQIQKRRKAGGYSLTLRWTAGHKGIVGNEIADHEAKKAAGGKTSEKQSLPPYLRKPLMTNPAAIKSAYHEGLLREWSETWKNSDRGRRAATIDKTAPSKTFLRAMSNKELSREAASRIAQLRLSHAPVNHYLKRIGKVDSARCPACGADDETIQHFLLSCPSYEHERWALNQQARKLRKQLSLGTLLGDQNMILPLANYIDATHRFKNSGEQSSH